MTELEKDPEEDPGPGGYTGNENTGHHAGPAAPQAPQAWPARPARPARPTLRFTGEETLAELPALLAPPPAAADADAGVWF